MLPESMGPHPRRRLHMAPRASRANMCPPTPQTSVDQQQTASSVDEESGSSTSSNESTSEDRTAGPASAFKNSVFSDSSRPLVDQQQSPASSGTIEDQLRKQITGLEDEISQLKLKPDPNRELAKNALLQEELAQLRDKNLNLRVDLEFEKEKYQALLNLHVDLEFEKEKYQALKSEYHEYQKQMGETIKKSTKDLLVGVDPSNLGPINLELTTAGVASGASLPSQESVSDPKAEIASASPSASQLNLSGSLLRHPRSVEKLVPSNDPAQQIQ